MSFSGTISSQIGQLQFLTHLILAGNSLAGEIPPQLGNTTSVKHLNLASNRLMGEMPNTLGCLSDLQYLDLSSNNLNGQIPVSLFQVHKYNFSGNHLNCSPNSPYPCDSISSSNSGSSKRSKSGILAGIIGAVVIILVLGLLLLLYQGQCRGNEQEDFVDVPDEHDLKIAFGQLKRFSWRELQLATDNFSEKNVLGKGGFGKVYKGVLADNTMIAVKRLTNSHSSIGEATFLREVEIINVAIHRNLLRLIGFCVSPSERILVYPYMQNLSVAYRLRG